MPLVKIRSISKNYRVILTKRLVYSFASGLTQNYTSIYIVKLGANPVQLGGLNTIGSLVSAVVSSITGWFADHYSLRKVYLASLAVTIISPLVYFIAKDWRLTLIPILIFHISMWTISLLETIIIAESLPKRNRATGFSLTYALSGLASIISPMVAGMILSYLGGLYVRNMRLLFLVQFIIMSCTFLWTVMNLGEVHVNHHNLSSSPFTELKYLFRSVGVKKWLIVESLGAFIFGAVNPFVMVYAAEIKGADALTLGIMGSVQNLTYMLSVIPVGRLADRIGRKWTILLLRPCLYASMLTLVFAPSKTYLIIAAALRGLSWGAMGAWSSIRMELVDPPLRGIWSGLIGMLRGLARAPASLIGGLLWANISPGAPFIMLVLVDVSIRMPLVLKMPETLALKTGE